MEIDSEYCVQNGKKRGKNMILDSVEAGYFIFTIYSNFPLNITLFTFHDFLMGKKRLQ